MLIKKSGYKYYIIKILYNRDQVIERINNRCLDSSNIDSLTGDETVNYSNSSAGKFLRVEQTYQDVPDSYIYVKIDNTKDLKYLELQVDKVLEQIKKQV